MCKSILQLFDGEKVAKAVRGSNAAAKAWLRGGFCPPKPNTPPKSQKSSFGAVPKTVSQNRRATGARMGLVSTHRLVNIMPNPYAMSRYGLRKLYFRCANVDFYCYFAVNRTKFSAQLAYGKMTLLNFSFMSGWCEVKIRFCSVGAK